jgi:prolyl-tRNA synthetase
MAVPVIKGVKTASERFAGAVDTLCIEALMQDGKALQAGTSHFLGQNFSKAFNCQFQNRDNELEYAWSTSWGVSTRLVGALVMAHSDDRGLVLPPRLAPTQAVIVPIYRSDEDKVTVLEAAAALKKELTDGGVRTKLDDREGFRPGWKFTEHEVQGVPLRLAVGPRDVQNGTVEMARRNGGDKQSVERGGLVSIVTGALDEIQTSLFETALAFRKASTRSVDDYARFKEVINDAGGFVLAHWDGSDETEARIKEETKATIRCMPLDAPVERGVDMVSGKPSERRVLFARAY